MSLQRFIVVLLVVLAVASAPISAALAGPHLAKHGATDQSASMFGPPDMSSMAEMTDCDRMMGKSGPADCPDCDPGKSCPLENCAAKCFKIFGALPLDRLLHGSIVGHRRSAGLLEPPDWSRAPPPPPPRT